MIETHSRETRTNAVVSDSGMNQTFLTRMRSVRLVGLRMRLYSIQFNFNLFDGRVPNMC